MTTSQICIIITIAVYLIAMVLVGVYFSKKEEAQILGNFIWAAESWDQLSPL